MDNKIFFLNKDKKEFNFEIEAEIDGEKTTGEFTSRYPTVIDSINIDIEKSRILRGADPDTLYTSTLQIAEMLAYCKYVLIKKPEWFNVEEIDDIDLLMEVYSKAREHELSFRRKDEPDGHREDSTRQTDTETVEG